MKLKLYAVAVFCVLGLFAADAHAERALPNAQDVKRIAAPETPTVPPIASPKSLKPIAPAIEKKIEGAAASKAPGLGDPGYKSDVEKSLKKASMQDAADEAKKAGEGLGVDTPKALPIDQDPMGDMKDLQKKACFDKCKAKVSEAFQKLKDYCMTNKGGFALQCQQYKKNPKSYENYWTNNEMSKCLKAQCKPAK